MITISKECTQSATDQVHAGRKSLQLKKKKTGFFADKCFEII